MLVLTQEDPAASAFMSQQALTICVRRSWTNAAISAVL